MELIKKTNFDFLGKRKYTYLMSLAFIVAGVVTFFGRGVANNFGVDFTGGDLLQVSFSQPTDVVGVRDAIAGAEAGDVTVQALGHEGKEFILKSKPETSGALRKALEEKYPGAVEVIGSSKIAPTMSGSLRRKSIRGFLFGVIGILIYLTIRFEFRFALTATLAILHDLLFTLSFLCFFGKQIDAAVIAGLLTIAGYSVNDTVIVFDRIRENIRNTRSSDYRVLFNRSINETLSRTVLTVSTVIFVVVCLLLFGGEPLQNLSFSLLVGFLVGTFSSVFVASALLLDWDRLSPHRFKL